MISKQEIRIKLLTNQRWLERAVVAIYEQQTSDEQYDEQTIERNNQGFTGGDAKFLSYCAKWILKGNHLSDRFIEKARRMMLKYAGQLAKLAKTKAERVG